MAFFCDFNPYLSISICNFILKYSLTLIGDVSNTIDYWKEPTNGLLLYYWVSNFKADYGLARYRMC